MNYLRHLSVIATFTLFSFVQMQAQDYQSAIGLRMGSPVSVSYKTFLSETNALEAFVSFRSNTISRSLGGHKWSYIGIGAAYQVHAPLEIQGLDGLYWYYGAGGSIYFWNYNDAFFDDYGNMSLGIQGYLGLDYKFDGAPINMSVDWVPSFFINGYITGFGANYGAFSVRYTF